MEKHQWTWCHTTRAWSNEWFGHHWPQRFPKQQPHWRRRTLWGQCWRRRSTRTLPYKTGYPSWLDGSRCWCWIREPAMTCWMVQAWERIGGWPSISRPWSRLYKKMVELGWFDGYQAKNSQQTILPNYVETGVFYMSWRMDCGPWRTRRMPNNSVQTRQLGRRLIGNGFPLWETKLKWLVDHDGCLLQKGVSVKDWWLSPLDAACYGSMVRVKG